MMYRAIKVQDGCVEVTYRHFDSITDAYKYFLPSLEDQKQDSWHIKLLWAVVEEFKTEPNWPTQKIAWNEAKNPETDVMYSLYIQKVDHTDDPLPNDM
jgi:hypothetical protein